MQNKRASAVEAFANLIIGMAVALGSQHLVFPLVGIADVSHSTHIQITLYFTAISFVRSYCVRRWFNGRLRDLLKKTDPESNAAGQSGPPVSN